MNVNFYWDGNKNELKMLAMACFSWEAQLWKTNILTPHDAMRHKKYHELLSKDHVKENPHVYLRWLAHHQHMIEHHLNFSWLTENDILNIGLSTFSEIDMIDNKTIFIGGNAVPPVRVYIKDFPSIIQSFINYEKDSLFSVSDDNILRHYFGGYNVKKLASFAHMETEWKKHHLIHFASNGLQTFLENHNLLTHSLIPSVPVTQRKSE